MSQRKVNWPFAKSWFRKSTPRKRFRTRLAPPVAAHIELLEDRTLLSTTLGTADTFAVLAGSAVTNTGPSVVTGDLGIFPNNASSITGFPPGAVATGTIHPGDAVALGAQADLTIAYNHVAGLAPTQNLTGINLGGLTLTPGVYFFSSSAQLTGTLTLNFQNNPNAEFDFQIGSSLTTASGSHVVEINTNGGNPCNIFWQVTSSATLGTTTAFVGHILALQSITVLHAATIQGSALASHGAVTLDDNTISVADCISGGRISGLKFNDLNNDGIQQPGEPGLAGLTVFLDLNHDGTLDPGDPRTTTDLLGNYIFWNLAAGTYTVRQVVPAGATATPAVHVVTLTAGQVVTGQNFADHFNTPPTPSTIQGTKFKDTNGDGIRNLGEPGVPGFTIFLDTNNNGVLDAGEPSTNTNASGDFTFSNLAPGTYHVLEVAQPTLFVQMSNNPPFIVIPASGGASVTGILFANMPVANLVVVSKLLLTGHNLTNLLNGTFGQQANFVANLFETSLGHAPDLAGLNYYLRLLMAGFSQQQVAAMFKADFKI